MPIYKQTTEITNIDDILSSVERDIEEVYFGDKNVFTVWGEYEGTLPATLNANGDDMKQYQVYGNVGGVGDRTVNILPPHFIRGTYEPTGFDPAYGNRAASSDIIHLPTGTYSIIHSQQYATYVITVSNGKRTSVAHSESAKIITFNAVSEADYVVQVNVMPMTDDIVARLESTTMLVEGSTAPAQYVPYGYGLSLSVTSPKSYTCEVNSLQASTNYAKIAVAELPTVKVGDKVTVTVGGTDYTLPVKNVDSSYVYIENMEV